MELELKQQQTLMSSLRVFVDTLRDIKQEKDANDVKHNIVAAVCALCASSETQNNGQWHDVAWRRGLVPLFQRLCFCMTQLGELEVQEKKQSETLTIRQDDKPKAPVGLLSLRDYSVLQAAIELLFCWGAYPRVAAGVLMPIEKRRPTRTLEISTDVLMWGYREYTRVTVDAESRREKTIDELLSMTQALLHLLSLPQFQPILLPKYVVELLALLVYGEVAVDTKIVTPSQVEFIRLRKMVLRMLPLRMSMSSLRAALGQTTPAASEQAVGLRFKARCGKLLSRLLMQDGGIVATIEMLLGAVEEGNTQARMQVVSLICQCPSGEDVEKYAAALCIQVCNLLLAAVTPEKGNTSSKLRGEMAALLADRLATQHTRLFDSHILSVLFHPLLIYEDSRADAMAPAREVSEEALTRCIGIAHLLVCGPPPSQQFLQALAPIIRPLLHMYAFAATSKSFLATPLRAVLTTWICSCSSAALLLQVSVLPVILPLQPALTACGYERNHPEGSWRPLRQFCAGGSGGISLRPIQSSFSLTGTTNGAFGSLKALITPLVELLGDKELQDSEVVGDLFSSLLLTYMHVRKGGEAEIIDSDAKNGSATSALALYEPLKTPTSVEGVEMVLMLLLTLIECLGPSVLRSAATVLQCIGTVLEVYNTPATHIAEKKKQSESATQAEDTEGEEGDEILTICLGVVMTILEVGSSHRSNSEEQQLREMLPVLEVLSRHPRPEAAELASNARAQILSRSAVDAGTNTTGAGKQSFEEVLQNAEQDLSSELVPLRARGVVTLTKLVRQSHSHACDTEWIPRVHTLSRVFMFHLHDSESYVFLAAVQGLAALSDVHPDVAIPALVKALGDLNNTLEVRIKLSEALLFSAKRCGETLPKYGKLFVYAYLDCIRPSTSMKKRVESMQKEASKPVQMVEVIQSDEGKVAATKDAEYPDDESQSTQELLASATLRASCLSNLAEVCALLQWGLQPYLVDVLTCVFGFLQLELALEAKHQNPMSASCDVIGDDDQKKLWKHQEVEQQQCVVTVRRGAVFLLRYLVELLGWKMLEIMPDHLSPLYHTLKHVARVDRDEVTIFHVKRALSALNDVMRAELFPRVEQQDMSFGISNLRIL